MTLVVKRLLWSFVCLILVLFSFLMRAVFVLLNLCMVMSALLSLLSSNSVDSLSVKHGNINYEKHSALILSPRRKYVQSHHWCGDSVYCGSSVCKKHNYTHGTKYCVLDMFDCPFGYDNNVIGVAETESDIFYLDFLWNNVLDYDVCVPQATAYVPSPFNGSHK